MKFILSLIAILGLAFNLSAQVFDYVVAKDGSGDFTTLQAAVDAAPDDVRTTIFVKSGLYEEKVMIGSHSKTSKKLLSVVGEDKDGVIISWDDHNGKTIIYDGREVTSGTPQSATFTVNAPDFYTENMTIRNTYTSKQAVALYNVGDRHTFKNCNIIGYQDTHYLKKGRRSYFLDCYIEGGTDYICAGGTAIFENCTLKSVRNSSYITAPEDISAYTIVGDKRYYYGFIFRNCILTSDTGVEVYLGRPWQGTSSSIFLSCKMINIKKEGWSTWSGENHLSSFFAEYNSLNADGNVLDVSNRADWSYQLTENEVNTYYTNDKIYAFVSGSYDPFTLVIAPDKPLNLQATTDDLTWDAVVDAKGYIIYENGNIIGFSTTPSFSYTSNLVDNSYYVKTVATNGNLSMESQSIGNTTGIGDNQIDEVNIYVKNGILFLPENQRCEIYSLSGVKVKSTELIREVNLQELTKGSYIVRVNTLSGVLSEKIAVK